MNCPSCKHENLPGADHCEECHASLHHPESYSESSQNHLIKDAVASIPLRESVVVGSKTSVADTISEMKIKNSSCVLVVNDGKLMGIFTERDVLQKIADQETRLAETQIQDLMTQSPEVLKQDDSIAFILNKMAMGSFRHVPIQNSDGSFSIVSVRDILNYLF